MHQISISISWHEIICVGMRGVGWDGCLCVHMCEHMSMCMHTCVCVCVSGCTEFSVYF